MELSIIVINWNTRDMLRDCLHSVFEFQPSSSFEVLIVDNASTDGSQSMVSQEFPNAKLLCNLQNLGFAAANNRALKVAKGEYMLLLNSDTLVHGDVLERSLSYMRDNGHVGAMGCRVLNADKTLQHSTSQFPSFFNLMLQTLGLDRISAIPFLQRYRMLNWNRDTTRIVDTVSGCYMMVRRDCIDEVGLLDEDFFFFGEETDWCRRMRTAGWDIAFAPVGEITHFGGGSSGSLNHKRDLMLTEATVRLHLKHGGVLAASTVFILLTVFNSSRFVFWWLRTRVSKDQKHSARMRHFLDVTREILAAWPKNGRAIV